MVDYTRDSIKYINEGVTILFSKEINDLIMLLKPGHTRENMQRALNTCKLQTQGTPKRRNGMRFMRLKEA